MNKKLKVLHILTGFGIGGAETWLLELVKLIESHPVYKAQIQIDFLLTGGKKEVLDDQFTALGAKLYYVRFSMGQIFSFRKKFISILKEEQYDALHSHQDFVSGWIFGMAAGNLPAVRLSYLHNPFQTLKNYLSKPHRYISYYIGRYLMYAFTTYISGTSKAAMDEYGYDKFPFKNKNIGPIYCGINPQKFLLNGTQAKQQLLTELEWQNKQVKISIFAGRIDLEDNFGIGINQKNPDFGYEIALALVKENAGWNFLFIGKKGKKGLMLEDDLKLHGLTERIKFLGVRSDLPSIMNASDILLFPSLWEGLGLVAVEAQASGLPVLASDTVPGEACIVKELYHTKSLQKTAGEWANEIISIAALNKPNPAVCNQKIAASGFSIQNSLNELIKTYSANEKPSFGQ